MKTAKTIYKYDEIIGTTFDWSDCKLGLYYLKLVDGEREAVFSVSNANSTAIIDSIRGSNDILLNTPIVNAEIISLLKLNRLQNEVTQLFETEKGSVVIRWVVTKNGEYSSDEIVRVNVSDNWDQIFIERKAAEKKLKQPKIDLLDSYKKEALQIIEKYNKLASGINFPGRVALAEKNLTYHVDYDEETEAEPNYDSLIENLDYANDFNIFSPGTAATWFWLPSSMNC